MEFDPEILENLQSGQELFNQGKFFEAHEVWEEKWIDSEGDERHLLQGLIQIAAGFYKLQVGMPNGTVKLLQKGSGHLREIPSDMYGVLLNPLLSSTEKWIDTARVMVDEFRTNYDEKHLPQLQINLPLH